MDATRLSRTYRQPPFAGGVDEGVGYSGPGLKAVLQYSSLLIRCRGRGGELLEAEASAVVGLAGGAAPKKRRAKETQSYHFQLGYLFRRLYVMWNSGRPTVQKRLKWRLFVYANIQR